MKFNTKFLYVLMAVGLILPTASVQAWSWKWGGAAPLIQKTQEKVQEEAKKEATKQSSLAWKATKVVGNAALDASIALVKGTGRFAWNNPRLSLGLALAGYTYYKHKEKIDKALPYIKTGAKAALMGYGAYKTVEATNNAIQAGSNLINGISNLMPQSNNPTDQANKSAAQVKTAEQINKENAEFDALADEWLNEYNAQQEVKQATAKQSVVEDTWAQEYQAEQVAIEAAGNRAQERVRLSHIDVHEFNNAWNVSVAQAAQEAPQVASHGAVELTQDPGFLMDRLVPHDRTETFAHMMSEREALQRMKAEALADAEQKHAWVQEFEEREAQSDAEVASDVKAFNALHKSPARKYIDRIKTIAGHLGINVDFTTQLNEAQRTERVLMMSNDIRSVSNASNPCQEPAASLISRL